MKEGLKSEFILLNVGHALHHADWNWKNVQSPFARIHYVLRGSAKIIREDGEYELRKNRMYLTPSNVKHAYECRDDLELYYIHIYENPGKHLSIFDLITFPIETEAHPLDIHLIERLIAINPERGLKFYDPQSYDNSATMAYNMAQQQKSPMAYELETEGMIKQLISRFLARAEYRNENMEKRILKSLHYIQNNMGNPIDIDTLANICSLSKDHFIRLFRKEMNCTPGKYINIKKIETAQLRILIHHTDIKDIAYGLGFDNMSYFNRLFKKITGVTPGKYKKEHVQNQ